MMKIKKAIEIKRVKIGVLINKKKKRIRSMVYFMIDGLALL